MMTSSLLRAPNTLSVEVRPSAHDDFLHTLAVPHLTKDHIGIYELVMDYDIVKDAHV